MYSSTPLKEVTFGKTAAGLLRLAVKSCNMERNDRRQRKFPSCGDGGTGGGGEEENGGGAATEEWVPVRESAWKGTKWKSTCGGR